jgi:lipopolysaccharide/colanic/teichoic acid biosynthesis glycosyltransferase
MIRFTYAVRSTSLIAGAHPAAWALSRRKRAIDLVLASVASLILVPVVLFICLAIVIDSGWPPLFAQQRVGLAGTRFQMWKFRTMRRDAEERRGELTSLNEAPHPVFKVRDDPRITRAGRVLRRASLDELPQLWNVVRGEMSIVGPRPPLPREVEQYDSVALGRLSARPGLTCTWQIERRRRGDISFDEWVQLDLDYLRHASALLDARLIGSTFLAIARMTGE